MNKKRALIILLISLASLVLGFIILSSPIEQYLLEKRINNNFEKINLPNNLVFDYKADFGDVLLGSYKDWGVQFVYTYTGDVQATYNDIVNTLESAGYSVNKNDGWVINASNTQEKIQMRITLSSKEQLARSVYNNDGITSVHFAVRGL